MNFIMVSFFITAQFEKYQIYNFIASYLVGSMSMNVRISNGHISVVCAFLLKLLRKFTNMEKILAVGLSLIYSSFW